MHNRNITYIFALYAKIHKCAQKVAVAKGLGEFFAFGQNFKAHYGKILFIARFFAADESGNIAFRSVAPAEKGVLSQNVFIAFKHALFFKVKKIGKRITASF